MICIGTGIVLCAIGIVWGGLILRDVFNSAMEPMAGIGVMVGFVAWLIPTLFGIVSILIGLLIRK